MFNRCRDDKCAIIGELIKTDDTCEIRRYHLLTVFKVANDDITRLVGQIIYDQQSLCGHVLQV